MRSVTMATSNWTRFDAINSATAYSLQDLSVGDEIIVNACAVGIDDVDSDEKEAVVFVTPDKEYYSSISATVIEQCDDIINILNNDADNITLRICKKMSKQRQREFIQVRIVDYVEKTV